MPAQLTLVKTVTNDNGGTAVPTAWTLTAAGPTPISGATGSAAVTNAPVNAGTYTLSESGGPAGYTASAWSCTGGTQTGASIALALGQSATCTINNNDIAAQLTLVKTVTNDNGGTAAADRVDLDRDRPDADRGATGSARGDRTRRSAPAATRCPSPVVRPATRRVGVVLRRRDADRRVRRVGARAVRDLHDQQQRPGRAADVGQDGDQRQRRHRRADRLDVARGRADADHRRDRVAPR